MYTMIIGMMYEGWENGQRKVDFDMFDTNLQFPHIFVMKFIWPMSEKKIDLNNF